MGEELCVAKSRGCIGWLGVEVQRNKRADGVKQVRLKDVMRNISFKIDLNDHQRDSKVHSSILFFRQETLKKI